MIVRLIPLGSLFDNALINSINRTILIVVHHRDECLVRSYELHGKSSRLCEYISSYDELLSKQGLAVIHIRNIQHFMTKVLEHEKGISPPITNEIFMLRNIL